MKEGYDAMYQSCFTVAALAFRDAIRSGRPFQTEAPDNLQALKIVEDVYRMAENRVRPASFGFGRFSSPGQLP